MPPRSRGKAAAAAVVFQEAVARVGTQAVIRVGAPVGIRAVTPLAVRAVTPAVVRAVLQAGSPKLACKDGVAGRVLGEVPLHPVHSLPLLRAHSRIPGR
jgi:hypothetical protein